MQPTGPPPASLQSPRGCQSDPSGDRPLRWDSSELTTAASMKGESMAEHDDTLLMAALEEIERARLAIETLQQGDLFKYCLGSQ
jgi:hypothetical protein